jgi:adenine-specific DNA-methyltransferase
MNGVSQFRTVTPWSEALGLLPVPLRETSERQTQYVLMNGNSGNFCLDFSGDLETADQRSTAWSCDVGHYVTCLNDYIVVNRWNRESREQRYSNEAPPQTDKMYRVM